MSYELTILPKPGYLHAIVTGVLSRENVAHYLADLRRECAARQCFRVLIEERLDGPRLGIMDVFRIISEESKHAVGVMEAVAYVDMNDTGDSEMEFAETVAVNRSVPARVFSSLADAERWIRR
jgi:hypothetical protein